MSQPLKFSFDNIFKTWMKTEVESVSKEAPVCPLWLGEPGIGKSSIAKAICEENGWLFFELLGNQLSDRADITGCRSVMSEEMIDGKKEQIWKQIFFPHQAIQDAITSAKQNPDKIVVLFIDEVNRVNTDITTALMSFMTARKVGSYTFPDNIRFVAAGNDKGAVVPLDTATRSRFVICNVEPDVDGWMAHEGTVNAYIKAVLTANPELIFCKPNNFVTSQVKRDDDDDDMYDAVYETFDDDAEDMALFTTPRTLSGLNALLNAMTKDDIAAAFSNKRRNPDSGEDVCYLEMMIKSHIGDTEMASKLLALIADDIVKGTLKKAQTSVAPKKPKFWKNLIACADRDTRCTMIDNMSDEEKSAAILYAVYEKNVDNSDLIETIAKSYSGSILSKDDHPALAALKSQDDLNEDNYNALIHSGTSLGDMIRLTVGE